MTENKAILVKPRLIPFRADYVYTESNAELIEFENTTEFLQKCVGGWIEHYQLSRDLEEMFIDCWINEEGKILDLEPTFQLCTNDGGVLDYILGNVVFTSFDNEGETYPLSSMQAERVQEWLNTLEQTVVEVKSTGKLYVVYKVKGFSSVWR